MGSCCQADAPTPPNPQATAAAQTGTNVSTAVANAQLNRVNQFTPQGSLNYVNAGNFSWTDPSTGQTYQIPLSSAQQSNLDPAQYMQLNPDVREAAIASGENPNTYAQRHYNYYGQFEGRPAGTNIDIANQSNQTKLNLSRLASQQSGALQNLLGAPIDTSGAPRAGDPNTLGGFNFATDYGGDIGRQIYGFGDVGDITRDYGSDGALQRDRVEAAMYARMAPQLEQDRLRMEARLRDQGNLAGGAAAENEQDRFARQLTDARLGITAAGGAEQKLQADIAAQRAGFQNAAQRQAFEQAQGRATFYNAAQQQDYTQAGLKAQFRNTALGQQLGAAQAKLGAENAARAQWLTEQYAKRNQPINEIAALMSGSQVSNPNWASVANANIPTTDYAGLVNNRFSQDFQNYQQSSQNFNQIMGGIFGAVAGLTRGATLSDRREKDVGAKLGTVFAAGHDGEKLLPIYEYKYKDDPTRTPRVGPMAQDVEKIDPKAVKTIRGTKYIDRTRLGSILKVA